MTGLARDRVDGRRDMTRGPLLAVENLDVYYGRSHALQGVTLTIERGVTAVVGRNRMGKTTLCNAITGLVRATGSVRFAGEEILGRAPHEITRRGIAYVPQGRRVWPSLTVDETLRLVAPRGRGRNGGGRRSIERIYAMFPRLAERKGHGGAQLSGGEQQMLAIGRALLLEPRLLVMDEPTEGLAPLIVQQVVQALRDLGSDGEITVLLIEQNLGVAMEVADRVGVMVNGRIARELTAQELVADRDLQQRLFGVRAGADEEPRDTRSGETVSIALPASDEPVQVLTVRRSHAQGMPNLDEPAPRTVRGFNRWNAGTAAPVVDIARDDGAAGTPASMAAPPTPSTDAASLMASATRPASPSSTAAPAQVYDFPVAASSQRAAYVAGTFDTKGRELFYLRQCLERLGMRVVTVDLSTSGRPSPASACAAFASTFSLIRLMPCTSVTEYIMQMSLGPT